MLAMLSALDTPSKREEMTRLYEQYKGPMWRYAMSLVHSESVADDIVQTVFQKIIEKYDLISTLSCNKLHSYIVIMVRNTCYSHFRQQKQHPFSDIEELSNLLPDGQDTPEERMMRFCDYEEVLAAKDRLRDSYKDVLTMKYVYQYTDDEIAQLMGIKPASVRVVVHRAIAALRKSYDKNDRKGETNE